MKEIIKKSKKYALDEIEKFGLPNKIHFEISEQKGIALAKALGADQDIVQVGVCLMDLKLGEAVSQNRIADHVQMSVDASREFLNQFDLDDEVKNTILNCVGAHHKDIPFKSIESEICANADCYRFISPKGFLLFMNILGERGLSFEESLKRAEEKLEEKWNILSLDICKEELEDDYKTIKNYITTSVN